MKAVVEDYLSISNRSTVSALIKVVEDWSSALDKSYEVCVILFAVSKAFVTVYSIAKSNDPQDLYLLQRMCMC